MTVALTLHPYLRRRDGFGVALIRRPGPTCPKMSRKPQNLRQKRHNSPPAARDKHLSAGIVTGFGDNAINGIVAFWAQDWRANASFRLEVHHVVAEGETEYPGRWFDAVGLHAGHDL
jgi:hypothetical protein